MTESCQSSHNFCVIKIKNKKNVEYYKMEIEVKVILIVPAIAI